MTEKKKKKIWVNTLSKKEAPGSRQGQYALSKTHASWKQELPSAHAKLATGITPCSRKW